MLTGGGIQSSKGTVWRSPHSKAGIGRWFVGDVLRTAVGPSIFPNSVLSVVALQKLKLHTLEDPCSPCFGGLASKGHLHTCSV